MPPNPRHRQPGKCHGQSQGDSEGHEYPHPAHSNRMLCERIRVAGEVDQGPSSETGEVPNRPRILQFSLAMMPSERNRRFFVQKKSWEKY
jgi:hypothetical protein